VNDETRAILEWLGRFIKTVEDGAIDQDEAREVLLALSDLALRIKDVVGRRWWKWLCTAASLALREGAAEIKRNEEEANETG